MRTLLAVLPFSFLPSTLLWPATSPTWKCVPKSSKPASQRIRPLDTLALAQRTALGMEAAAASEAPIRGREARRRYVIQATLRMVR